MDFCSPSLPVAPHFDGGGYQDVWEVWPVQQSSVLGLELGDVPGADVSTLEVPHVVLEQQN